MPRNRKEGPGDVVIYFASIAAVIYVAYLMLPVLVSGGIWTFLIGLVLIAMLFGPSKS